MINWINEALEKRMIRAIRYDKNNKCKLYQMTESEYCDIYSKAPKKCDNCLKLRGFILYKYDKFTTLHNGQVVDSELLVSKEVKKAWDTVTVSDKLALIEKFLNNSSKIDSTKKKN